MWRAGCFLLLCLMPLVLRAEGAALALGDKVWLPLDAPNLRDDGYAVGKLQALHGDTATLLVDEWVEGAGRTLYGSCTPGTIDWRRLTPSNAAATAPKRLESVPLARLLSWRSGRFRFLEREQLATLYYKWRGDALGLPARRARMAASKAADMGLFRLEAAFRLVEADVRLSGADGFPRPVQRQLQHWPPALKAIEDVLAAHPELLLEAGSDPADLLASALATLAMRQRARLQDLARLQPDFQTAQRDWPELAEVYRRAADWLGYPDGLMADSALSVAPRQWPNFTD